MAEVGPCPDGGRLKYESAYAGFVPGNAEWGGDGMFKRSFAECTIAVAYLKAGLINEETALILAALDEDTETVRQRFMLLDRETAGESAAKRRKAIAGLVQDFVYRNGTVPIGEPTRWQIRSEMEAIKRENYIRDKDVKSAAVPEFPGDPRVTHKTRTGLAMEVAR